MNTVKDPFNELPEDEQVRITELAQLGHLDTEVSYGGHTFGLRTLYIEEELAAARAIKDYSGTMREPQAWSTAIVGASLTHIDNDADFCPSIGPDIVTHVKGRFFYLSKNLHWPIVEFLYSHVAMLSQEQAGIISRVENLSEADPSGSIDLEQAMIDAGLFNDPTDGAGL